MDTIRVLRIIEYIGPRDLVEEQIKRSIHGTKNWGNGITINVATLGTFPEILAVAKPSIPVTWDDYEMSVRAKALMKLHYPYPHTPATVMAEWRKGEKLPPGITRKVMNEIKELEGIV